MSSLLNSMIIMQSDAEKNKELHFELEMDWYDMIDLENSLSNVFEVTRRSDPNNYRDFFITHIF